MPSVGVGITMVTEVADARRASEPTTPTHHHGAPEVQVGRCPHTTHVAYELTSGSTLSKQGATTTPVGTEHMRLAILHHPHTFQGAGGPGSCSRGAWPRAASFATQRHQLYSRNSGRDGITQCAISSERGHAPATSSHPVYCSTMAAARGDGRGGLNPVLCRRRCAAGVPHHTRASTTPPRPPPFDPFTIQTT